MSKKKHTTHFKKLSKEMQQAPIFLQTAFGESRYSNCLTHIVGMDEQSSRAQESVANLLDDTAQSNANLS